MSSDPSVPDARAVAENIDSKDLVFGRTVVPVANRNKAPKKGKLGFEYAEHCFIGDAITLTLASGEKVAASDYKFQLKDQLSLTYGQINGLAGDFYGTYDPISDGKTDQDRSARFVQAYNTLADGGPRLPKEAMDILAVLQTEVDAVNNALANHQDPSVVYAKLPDVSAKLELITFGRSGIPAYLGLAQINWDHFGADARTAYNAGHATAIQKAISGDLDGAYAMNAFADHFLEDSFSAGHLRTPRRLLHKSTDITADACAKYMHDEDNAIGIDAKNPAGQSWTLYGDKRALDSVNEDNKTRCVDSVQASADEIYEAYQTKQIPSPANYRAWTFAPTLESANAHQTLATLFTFTNERRKVIEDRKLWSFKTDWWFWSTALECKTSGWWNYPITINGLQNIIPWSAVAVTTPRVWHIHVFYQQPGGGILQSEHLDGLWGGGPSKDPIFNAVLFTPLAAINFNGGKEVRVYYLDEQYVLQEYCYSADKGRWFPGELGGMRIQAATNTSIAAIQYGDDRGGVHIRVYCQELASGAIKELCNDGYWSRGATLPGALSGSSIAAVAYSWNGLQLRVYYQTDDLSIKEHCLNDNSEWFPGKLDFGKAPGCVPISALGYGTSDGGAELHVYWRNLENEIVGTKNTGSWGPVNKVVGGLKPGTQFAAAQWSNGKNLRLYYQTADDSVLEMVNDGTSWVDGASVGNAH
ncbi:fungal fucose-specific lectin-domain-containing protein [Armillaria luteobubalina]|uniref:Fungal fucose-specific lectin-domain-containing protein n=1 Tax=Armillaria luteobubalina TaxID=153913 RepID=A0AA39PJD8_9AGAR|nr:fungal fucose-specific lectin-domain-containing protein [Armillaria luteobubalina]